MRDFAIATAVTLVVALVLDLVGAPSGYPFAVVVVVVVYTGALLAVRRLGARRRDPS